MADPTYRDGLRNITRDIAATILQREGLAALQARKIALAANCSVGTLYNIWRNLDELTIAANAVTLAQFGNLLVAARDGTGSDADLEPRLLALAEAYVRFAVENQPAWRALFDHRMAPAHTVPDWYRDAQRGLFAIVETVLQPYVPDLAERARASRALFGSVHGIVSLALDEKLGNFDRADCEAQVRFIVAAAARGLAHRP